MPLITLELNNLSKYKEVVINIYKYTVIFLVFVVLMKLSFKGKSINLGFSDKTLFSNNIVNTLCILLISYMSYELVFTEIIKII